MPTRSIPAPELRTPWYTWFYYCTTHLQFLHGTILSHMVFLLVTRGTSLCFVFLIQEMKAMPTGNLAEAPELVWHLAIRDSDSLNVAMLLKHTTEWFYTATHVYLLVFNVCRFKLWRVYWIRYSSPTLLPPGSWQKCLPGWALLHHTLSMH